MARIAVLFDNLGPYHIARLAALGMRCDLLCIEQYATSAEYAWAPEERVPFRRTTLFDHAKPANPRSSDAIQRATWDALAGFAPDVVVAPGWVGKQAISAAIWCRSHNVPVIVMSDSQEIDFPRKARSEWVKKRYLACCNGAIVAGKSHEDYLVKLGVRRDRIRRGYDVVDNQYFQVKAATTRQNATALRLAHGLPIRYFLSSARFVEKKNLFRLIEAFFLALQETRNRASLPQDWHLVILGDGFLRAALEQQVAAMGLSGRVLLPGFMQYDDLPTFYGLAEAFILPSTTEQWGLVVNEAMASGLPVLVSERCGSAGNLIQDGVNGYTFDPYNVEALTSLMVQVAGDEERRRAMGRASLRIIEAWSPEVFAQNLLELAQIVKASPRSQQYWLDSLLLRVMLNHMSVPHG